MANPCCERYVVNGRQERMIKLTATLIYPRLKLLSAMFM
eukprot:CAMPEP_0172655976 /NCGR_PEP_ID=MMETSP1074-20121228/1036_1 /TAXON_ID=2916 /ORGANISM="Ceratium fusus, Strain PA161109" /LENGTH=38 /DNA_ID= /DNA_START= /DNA_END= /DNA_ORIENTATION=